MSNTSTFIIRLFDILPFIQGRVMLRANGKRRHLSCGINGTTVLKNLMEAISERWTRVQRITRPECWSTGVMVFSLPIPQYANTPSAAMTTSHVFVTAVPEAGGS
jgi:hypothetical protein